MAPSGCDPAFIISMPHGVLKALQVVSLCLCRSSPSLVYQNAVNLSSLNERKFACFPNILTPVEVEQFYTRTPVLFSLRVELITFLVKLPTYSKPHISASLSGMSGRCMDGRYAGSVVRVRGECPVAHNVPTPHHPIYHRYTVQPQIH